MHLPFRLPTLPLGVSVLSVLSHAARKSSDDSPLLAKLANEQRQASLRAGARGKVQPATS